MAGITCTGNRLFAPTKITTISKTERFNFTSLHSKVFGFRFQTPKYLSKSGPLISLSRSSSSVVASAHVGGGGDLSSRQIVSEEGNGELKQAKNFEDMDTIPVVDLSNPDENHVISQIHAASKNWGFFQVVNHGLSPELFSNMKMAATNFFGLPMEEKKKSLRNEEQNVGFYDVEYTGKERDLKEGFDFILQGSMEVPLSSPSANSESNTIVNKWPDNPMEFREVFEGYASTVEKFGYRLLELLSLSLGLPNDKLRSCLKNHVTYCRINYYPKSNSKPSSSIGLGAHKDFEALTLLYQDGVGGLEVKRKTDGKWIPVKPVENSLIINIGDVIQVWTNGLYESVEHRVVRVSQEKARISIPIFFLPALGVEVQPLPELLNATNPPRYRPYNFGRYATDRSKLAYEVGFENEEFHVDHFKV